MYHEFPNAVGHNIGGRFASAVTKSDKYDDEIRRLLKSGLKGEPLFFELALQDLSRAADLFLPVHQQTATVDGWVSLEVSPLLAYDTDATIAEAKRLYKKAGKPNLFIKIPGTKEGLPAIEEAIFSGVTSSDTKSDKYDDEIRRLLKSGLKGEHVPCAGLHT